MKYLLVLALMAGFTACNDSGTGDERREDKPVVTHDQPSSNPNATSGKPSDTTSHVQDSSTLIDYDTSSKRK